MPPKSDDDLRQIPPLREDEVAVADQPGNLAAPNEAVQLGSGRSSAELRREAENNEHGRTEKFRNHFERIVVIGLYGLAGVFLIVSLIWFWHLVMPEQARWLTPDDISRLQNFVTGGVIATIAGGHVKRRLG